MDGEPKRVWWQKKRWQAAVALGLAVVAYPLTIGPVAYGVGRGWLSPGWWYLAIYAPAGRVLSAPFPEGGPYSEYQRWWLTAGLRDRPPSVAPPAPPPPIRGELPRLVPNPDTPAGPVAAADLPPLPGP